MRSESGGTGTAALPKTACPACDEGEACPILFWPEVPAFQNAPAATEAEALACRRGDIRLTCCLACGFVFNAAFDTALTAYAPGYEPTQTHSPAFRRYLDDLVRALTARHDLRGKTILEVGCGAGDFLLAICRDGANRGIGFDPSYAGELGGLPPNVTIYPEPYSRAHPPADLVCARHVIEHVGRPVTLLTDMRAAVEGRAGGVVFVETPRLEWILERCAFWDVFYEHCSYFTGPVLMEVMERAGFAVLGSDSSFAGQYQWVEGRCGPRRARAGRLGETLATRLEAFAREAETRRDAWRARVADLARRGPCVVWGAGAKGITFLNSVGLGRDIVPAVVDMNPKKQGRYVPGTGQPIVPPTDLARLRPSSVLVMNPNYLDEIRAMVGALAPGTNVLAI